MDKILPSLNQAEFLMLLLPPFLLICVSSKINVKAYFCGIFYL